MFSKWLTFLCERFFQTRIESFIPSSINSSSGFRALKWLFRWQFYQHITCTFFVQKFCTKLFLYLHLRFELFWHKNIGANVLIKCWWNWPQERKTKNPFYFNFEIFSKILKTVYINKSLLNIYKIRLILMVSKIRM